MSVQLIDLPEELLERILRLVLAPSVSIWSSSPPPPRLTTAPHALTRSSSLPSTTARTTTSRKPFLASRLPVPGYAPLLVCTHFHRIGTPILYAQLSLSSPAQVRLVQRTLQEHPILAAVVRSLRIEGVWACVLDLVRVLLKAQTSIQLSRLESFDFCLDTHTNSPANSESDSSLFCDALALLPKFGTVRHLTVRKAQNVYINLPGPAFIFERLGAVITRWNSLEVVDVARIPTGPPVTATNLTAAHIQLHPPQHNQGPTAATSRAKAHTNFVVALSRAPNLKVMHTHIPAVWNTQLLEISQNPSLKALVVTPSPSASGASLYFSIAKRHLRLYELIEAGVRLTTPPTIRKAGPPLSSARYRSVHATTQAQPGPGSLISRMRPHTATRGRNVPPPAVASASTSTASSHAQQQANTGKNPNSSADNSTNNSGASTKLLERKQSKKEKRRAKAARRVSII